MSTASINMEQTLEFKESIKLPWNQPNGIPKVLTQPPSLSLDNTSKEATPVIAPYTFRISRNGDQLILLAQNPKYLQNPPTTLDFIVCDPESNSRTSLTLPVSDFALSGKSYSIIDFQYFNNTIFILDQVKVNKQFTNRLQALFDDNTHKTLLQWDNTQSDTEYTLTGIPQDIIKITKEAIFLRLETHDNTQLIAFDTNTKSVKKIHEIENTGIRIFMDDKETLHYIKYDPSSRNRALITYNTKTQQENIQWATTDIYNALTFPTAIDTNANIYTADGFSIHCFSSKLKGLWHKNIENINIAPDQSFWVSEYRSESQELRIKKIQASTTLLDLTIQLKRQNSRLLKLKGVLDDETLVLESIENHNPVLLQYNLKSKRVQEIPSENTGSMTLQASSYWQIDDTGRLYLPIASDDALHIVVLTINTHQP